MTTNLRLLGRADFGPQHLFLKIRLCHLPLFIKDYVMPQGKNGNLASLMNIGTDRQELITSGPPSTPGGQLTTLNGGGGGGGSEDIWGFAIPENLDTLVSSIFGSSKRYFGVLHIMHITHIIHMIFWVSMCKKKIDILGF